MWAIKAMIDSRLRLCSQTVCALLKARFFCPLILVFCKSFLAASVAQSQLFINLFLIMKVFLWPESWRFQGLLFQEEDCILMCGNISGVCSARWSLPLNIRSYVLLTVCDQGACANMALLVNVWMATYFSYFNPQAKNSSWNDHAVPFPWEIHKWSGDEQGLVFHNTTSKFVSVGSKCMQTFNEVYQFKKK